MKRLVFASFVLTSTLVVYGVGVGGTNFCSWTNNIVKCPKTEFRCLNGQKCISRELYCDGVQNCNDGSDERYCSSSSCPENFISCRYGNKCIPREWICNGFVDCQNIDYVYDDSFSEERNCGRIDRGISETLATKQSTAALNKVQEWIRSQEMELNSPEKWGSNVDKLSLIYWFAYEDFHTLTKDDLTYELNIQLLLRLSSMKLGDISSTELASFINAFLVACMNPRNFYGYDIIQELRDRVNKEHYTNPYVLLALCNAGETITESDKKKLTDTFQNKHRTIWTGMQAVVVMALACANKQPGNEVDSETLSEMTLELKQHQYRNGTVINLPTTALVMQALISTESESDPDNFDEKKALQELLRNQKSDGSFGDIMNTLLVTPVLTCKSLMDIKADQCQYRSRDEVSALENLTRRSGPKIRVQYSLWIGNAKDVERNLVLRVPQNTSLYGIMEIAAEVDSRFKFEYSVQSRKPYINAISEMRDNPLTGKFWFLYIAQSEQPTLTKESPADIIPKNNDHYAMWYRNGDWIDKQETITK